MRCPAGPLAVYPAGLPPPGPARPGRQEGRRCAAQLGPPRFGQLIRFHYVGYTATDDSLEPFDSSYERRTPYFTKHGNGFTVQGLEEALQPTSGVCCERGKAGAPQKLRGAGKLFGKHLA